MPLTISCSLRRPVLYGAENSQAWALERLSYSHMHIDRTLLDACVAASDGEPHRQAADMARTNLAKALGGSMSRTRSLLWETCRMPACKCLFKSFGQATIR